MAKKTPPILTKGRYTLISPWAASPTVFYTCVAIRSFDDIYKLGQDVQTIFYKSKGLEDGSILTSPAFSFATEKTLKPNIITLLGEDGSVIYVPDTFIASYPNMTEMEYAHMVLSVSLGALPNYLDLTAVKTAVAGVVSQFIGVAPPTLVVNEHRAPATNNPTAAEHETLEVARLSAITNVETDHAKVIRLENEKAILQAQINTLIATLKANHIPPF